MLNFRTDHYACDIGDGGILTGVAFALGRGGTKAAVKGWPWIPPRFS